MTHEVKCPSCAKRVAWVAESRWRPFCSERCKLIDLGAWAAERHVVPGTPDDTMHDETSDGTAASTTRRGH